MATSPSPTAKAVSQPISAPLLHPLPPTQPQDQPTEPQDTVLDIDAAAPGDCLYRICRLHGGYARVVYVHVLSADFIAEDDRTYGPAVVRRLSTLADWRREWKTLTISASDKGDATLLDTFKPHSISPEYVHGCYPLFDIADFGRHHHIKTRIWRCPAPGGADAQVYVKLARFKFETKALEQEVKAYHMLRGSALAPALVGYVYEETQDRVVGFVTEQVVGHYPRDATTDYAACLAALRSLHEWGLVHGDVNRHNIIMTKDGSRFIDFEASGLRSEVRNWKQLMQNEEQSLAASLSDQSGLGAPWQQ